MNALSFERLLPVISLRYLKTQAQTKNHCNEFTRTYAELNGNNLVFATGSARPLPPSKLLVTPSYADERNVMQTDPIPRFPKRARSRLKVN